MAILETLIKEHVKFDPLNPEHRQAYLMLMYQKVQHPTLRFILQVPHTSVVHMMQSEMAALICKNEIEQMGIDIYEMPKDTFKGMLSEVRPAEDRTPPAPVVPQDKRIIDLGKGLKEDPIETRRPINTPFPHLSPYLHRLGSLPVS